MTTWKTTYISAVVHRSTEDPMLAELATRICLIDEGSGAFVELEDGDGNKLRLDPDELHLVAETAQKMLRGIDGEHSDSGINPNQTDVTEWFDGMRDSLVAAAKDNIDHKAARDLLAVIHRDGGHHNAKVGFLQSCKDAESVVLKWRDVFDERNKSIEWTSTKPTKGGVYWVQMDRGLDPATVEVYRPDDDDVWRMRVVGSPAGILATTVTSCQVSSLHNALWNGPLSAPDLPA